MDPLSEMLALLDIRAAEPSRFEAAGQWALRFEGHHHVKVGAVLAGEFWLSGDEPIHLLTGDCYLLASGRPYVCASDLDLVPSDGQAAFDGVYPDTVYYNTTPDAPGRTVLAGGAVTFDSTAAALMLDCLPPSVRIASDSHRAQVLRPILQLLADETATDTPGSATMREQLTLILFVQILRTLLASDIQLGWLGALNDENIGAALALIHRKPEYRWTVADLASAAGMSRSTFAMRFKTLVGVPPLEYLARWRMQSAIRAVRATDRTIASIAGEFGYGSEAAFSNAFKRITGHPPTHYRARGEPHPS
ncbi:AraC family transcriptional regulator [Saccharopolyspora sp. K220]|uniref:AraC family transcriptional regulator n=1 Tax=Saccharopolyspora soli TaxID=2926618 RepID=UPI001F5A4D3A|nr:AraC family transcriptional regulator [Saccharopolyspora soli]MCI2420598.1 AraC family transcriptional regulator [Saccharopolyspora soli]